MTGYRPIFEEVILLLGWFKNRLTAKEFRIITDRIARLFMLGCRGLVPTSRIDYITPNGNQGKSSSSQFHSFWLTYKFNLPNQLTFVELTKKEKENI